MSMTRKDYQKFADLVRKYVSTEGKEGKEYIEMFADDLSIILAEDNPRFDRDKFMRACGYEN